MCLGGIFDYAEKQERLQEVELELGEPSVWEDPDKAQALGKERSALEAVVKTTVRLAGSFNSDKAFAQQLQRKIFPQIVASEAQQEAASQSPEGKLMLREHDKAVAYSRQAIHAMQKAAMPQAAE